MAGQTNHGKAFEYARIKAYQQGGQRGRQEIPIEHNAALKAGKRYFSQSPAYQRRIYQSAAQAGASGLQRLDPNMFSPQHKGPRRLLLQPDAAGIDGDHRDLRYLGGDAVIAGESCKYNNTALCHFRLSSKRDVIAKLFGVPCSQEYRQEMDSVFSEVGRLSVLSKRTAKWSDLGARKYELYLRALRAFMAEVRRVYLANPAGSIPERFIRHCFGWQDLYRVIAWPKRKRTRVECFNFSGMMGCSPDGTPNPNIPRVEVPTRFLDISMKEKSRTTAIFTCDKNFVIACRAHNAKTELEQSLKLDVRALVVPDTVVHLEEPWGNN